MQYNVGDSVYVNDFQTLKEIRDCEVIDGREIYYMEDGTSYEKSQLLMSINEKINLYKNNKEVIQSLAEEPQVLKPLVDKLSQAIVTWYFDYEREQELKKKNEKKWWQIF